MKFYLGIKKQGLTTNNVLPQWKDVVVSGSDGNPIGVPLFSTHEAYFMHEEDETLYPVKSIFFQADKFGLGLLPVMEPGTGGPFCLSGLGMAHQFSSPVFIQSRTIKISSYRSYFDEDGWMIETNNEATVTRVFHGPFINQRYSVRRGYIGLRATGLTDVTIRRYHALHGKIVEETDLAYATPSPIPITSSSPSIKQRDGSYLKYEQRNNAQGIITRMEDDSYFLLIGPEQLGNGAIQTNPEYTYGDKWWGNAHVAPTGVAERLVRTQAELNQLITDIGCGTQSIPRNYGLFWIGSDFD